MNLKDNVSLPVVLYIKKTTLKMVNTSVFGWDPDSIRLVDPVPIGQKCAKNRKKLDISCFEVNCNFSSKKGQRVRIHNTVVKNVDKIKNDMPHESTEILRYNLIIRENQCCGTGFSWISES
jgi:hypothetical protein